MKIISVYFNQIAKNWSGTVITNPFMNKIRKSAIRREKKESDGAERAEYIFG